MTEYGNYYELLGVPAQATDAEISAAFQREADKYNPSSKPSEENERRFQALLDAYSVLHHPDSRAQYDAHIFEIAPKPSPNPLKMLFKRKNTDAPTREQAAEHKTVAQLLDFDWEALDEPTEAERKADRIEFRFELLFKLIIILAFVGLVSLIWIFL